MIFPVAGIEVAPWIPPLVAFVVSFFTSMGGVSGAFLLLPFQMSFLGYTSPSVSATNQLFNIVAIPSGVYRYWREGRMVWPLTWVIVIGTLPGVLLGALIRVNYLPDPRRFKLFAAGVLLYLGGKMVRDLLKRRPEKGNVPDSEKTFRERVSRSSLVPKMKEASSKGVLPVLATTRFDLKYVGYSFNRQIFEVPFWGIFFLSLLVGIVGGVYGIGGGAIIAPFLVSFFRLPVYSVAGASLMGTFVTSVAGVAFYQAIAPFYLKMSVAPDWLLGLFFGLGGMAGMYLGARCQKFVPAKHIKWMLAGVMMFTAVKYVIDSLR